MTIRDYNNHTGRQIKGMHCFQCGKDEVSPQHRQHGDKLYVDFRCLNCGAYIGLPVTEADRLASLDVRE